jgi:hypothetical protein
VLLAKYYQVDQIKDLEISGEWRNVGGGQNAYRISVGKSERKRPLERTRFR